MRELVLSFRAVFRSGKLAALHSCLERAQNTGIHAMMTRFVRTLKQGLGAGEAAVTEPWSNGPVEGHINRLKTLKRQMYGRAGVELLRARLLPETLLTGQGLHQTWARPDLSAARHPDIRVSCARQEQLLSVTRLILPFRGVGINSRFRKVSGVI
jgi:hypothetical protein